MRILMLLCIVLLLVGNSIVQADKGHPFACVDNSKGSVMLVSSDGEIEWEYPAKGAQDVWRLSNGNVLLTHRLGVKEVSPEKKVVWEYKTKAPNEIHSCQPLADGSVLIGELGSCRLIEVDREGEILKEIKLKTKTKKIHLQFRICRKTRLGTYLVAYTGEHEVREIDEKGAVVRVIKTPGDPFVAVRLSDGNTLIACGDGHRLIEVDQEDKIVWQITEKELPQHPLRFVAGVQRLANGNTVVCNWSGHGQVGRQAQIFEVTRDKRIVWQVFDNERFKTISSVQVLDEKGDPSKGEVLR